MQNTFKYPNRQRESNWVDAVATGTSVLNGNEANLRRVTVRRSDSIESLELRENSQGDQGGGEVRIQIPEDGDLVQVVVGGKAGENGGGGDGGGTVGGKVFWLGGGGKVSASGGGKQAQGFCSNVGKWISGVVDLCRNRKIQIQNGRSTEKKGPSILLERDYQMKYYTGICTFKLLSENTNGQETWGQWITTKAKKLAFRGIFLFSEFHSLCFAKKNLLQLIATGEYGGFAGFAYHLGWLLAKIVAYYIFSSMKAKTEDIYTAMRKYEEKYPSKKEAKGWSWTWGATLVTVNAILTIISAVVRAFYATDDDNVEDAILSSSYQLASDLLKWNSKNDTALIDQLDAAYGTNITPTTVTMGSVGIIRNVASNYTAGNILNTVLYLAIILAVYMNPLIEEVKAVTYNLPWEDVEGRKALQARREKVWKQYRELRSVFAPVNIVFPILFILLHVTNMMSFAFFLTQVIYEDRSLVTLFLFTIELVKVVLWYIIAGRIAEQNDVIRKWIRNWSMHTGKFTVDGVEYDTAMVFDELDKEPIGLGKGKFFISETFYSKFMALVGTIFFSMAEENGN